MYILKAHDHFTTYDLRNLLVRHQLSNSDEYTHNGSLFDISQTLRTHDQTFELRHTSMRRVLSKLQLKT